MPFRKVLVIAAGVLLAQEASAEQRIPCAIQTGWVQQGHGSIAFAVPGIAGTQKIEMLIDSGVPKSIVDSGLSAVVKNLSLYSKSESAYGGKVALRHGDEISVLIENRPTRLSDIEIADLSQINSTGSNVRVIIGRDVLDRCAISIDSDRSRFRVGESGERLGRGTDEVKVPISYEHGRPEVETRIGSGNGFLALLDTGMMSGLIVDSGTWPIIKPKGILETSTISAGLGGWMVSALAVAPKVSIGGFGFNDVDIRIDAGSAEGGKPQIGVGVIGSDMLQMANVVLDFRNRSMTMSMRVSTPSPHVKSTSGVLSMPSVDRLRILHIMKGSPAAEAGITDKDQICKIDGQAIASDYETSSIRAWSRDRPGRTVQLTLCDGRAKQVVLREFY